MGAQDRRRAQEVADKAVEKSIAISKDERSMSVSTEGKRKEGGLAEGGRVVFHALLIALVIRTLLFQPFNIPSGSMKATLLIGDYLFVSKYSYGYSHYSLPLSPPLFPGRIFGSMPERGDVVVFRLPKDDSTDYIKRVIGLPGDRIKMVDGVLHINGVAVKRERVDDFIDDENGTSERVRRWRETLPNGVTYQSLDLQDNGFLDNTQEYLVPPGHYFMMETIATIRLTAVCCRRSDMCRSRISSARHRSFSSPSAMASPPGTSGAGHGRCVGAGSSRLSDEPKDGHLQTRT